VSCLILAIAGFARIRSKRIFPFLKVKALAGTFYVRVHGTPQSFLPSLREIVRSADPALPMTDFRTLDEQVDRSLNAEHMLATLSGSFSTLALLLSLVGLYGVMSFVVTQRTREIGIRLALGATRWSAIWLVLRDALAMILAGIGIGLPVVWVLGRLVESQLYEVKPSDPAVIAIHYPASLFGGARRRTDSRASRRVRKPDRRIKSRVAGWFADADAGVLSQPRSTRSWLTASPCHERCFPGRLGGLTLYLLRRGRGAHRA